MYCTKSTRMCISGGEGEDRGGGGVRARGLRGGDVHPLQRGRHRRARLRRPRQAQGRSQVGGTERHNTYKSGMILPEVIRIQSWITQFLL